MQRERCAQWHTSQSVGGSGVYPDAFLPGGEKAFSKL